jgi:hypothetical protein
MLETPGDPRHNGRQRQETAEKQEQPQKKSVDGPIEQRRGSLGGRSAARTPSLFHVRPIGEGKEDDEPAQDEVSDEQPRPRRRPPDESRDGVGSLGHEEGRGAAAADDEALLRPVEGLLAGARDDSVGQFYGGGA